MTVLYSIAIVLCLSQVALLPQFAEGQRCELGKIRYSQNSNSPSNDLLEICGLRREYELLCNFRWGNEEAKVACRALGYGSNTIATPKSEATAYSYRRRLIYNCAGSESTLRQCSTESSYLLCNSAAGVSCEPKLEPCDNSTVNIDTIRITPVSKDARFTGTVQVCRAGVWWDLCNRNWNTNGARLVCQELFNTSIASTFGLTHRINSRESNSYSCQGNESNLLECKTTPNSRTCSTAGVDCVLPEDFCSSDHSVHVRLVSGTQDSSASGTVEMCTPGTRYRQLCRDNWGCDDARVACYELGFGAALRWSGSGRLNSYYNINVSLSCSGREHKLESCSRSTRSVCNSHNNIHLTCEKWRCTDGDVKLFGGNASQGRLQMCIEGVWAPVTSFNQQAASIACKQLGYHSAKVLRYCRGRKRGRYTIDNRYSVEVYSIVINNIQCSGTHSNLTDCMISNSYSSYHQEQCVLFETHVFFNELQCLNTSCLDGSYRIVGPQSPQQGQVQICKNENWIPVRDFDRRAATFICKSLGFQEYPVSTRSKNVHNDNLERMLSETKINSVLCQSAVNLTNCSVSLTMSTFSCEVSYNIRELRCYESTGCKEGALRLIGPTENNGRVEVCSNGVWGTLCSNSYSVARVVCSRLGFVGKNNRWISTPGIFPFFFGYSCGGWEQNISDCFSSERQIMSSWQLSCYSASLDCSDFCRAGVIRLVGGPNSTSGVVEICQNNRWGLITGPGWSDDNAAVVCRQLGLPTRGAQAIIVHMSRNSDSVTSYQSDDEELKSDNIINLPRKVYHRGDVICTGREKNIQDCSSIEPSFTPPGLRAAGVVCRSDVPSSAASQTVTAPSSTKLSPTVSYCSQQTPEWLRSLWCPLYRTA